MPIEISYERPTHDGDDVYKFGVPTSKNHMHNLDYINGPTPLKVGSVEAMVTFQEGILDVADTLVSHLKSHPEGISGNGRVWFDLFGVNPRRGIRHFFKEQDYVGFPRISIETDLGTSQLSIWPHMPHEPNGYISIVIVGGGLAEEAATANLEKIAEELHADARLEPVEIYGRRNAAFPMADLMPLKRMILTNVRLGFKGSNHAEELVLAKPDE